MAYDRADWHYGGNFPSDLPSEAGGTHIGMFLAWAITRGLEGDLHREESAESLRAVREHRMTGRDFLMRECDEKFVDEDLNDEGNAFTKAYYEKDGLGSYLADYEDVLGGALPSTGDSPNGQSPRSQGTGPDNKGMKLTKPSILKLRSLSPVLDRPFRSPTSLAIIWPECATTSSWHPTRGNS
jgi:hypothetical protein